MLDRLRKLPPKPDEASPKEASSKAKDRKRALRTLTLLSAYLNLLQQPSHLGAFVRQGQLSCIPELSRRINVAVSCVSVEENRVCDMP